MSSLIICGNGRPGPRATCPDPLHDWPLPSGYVDAADAAARRLRTGWKNQRCPKCGLYGWREGAKRDENDRRVPAGSEATDDRP